MTVEPAEAPPTELLEEKREVCVGLLAALVSPELQAFWDALAAEGWVEETGLTHQSKRRNLRAWRKTINGRNGLVYTGVIGSAGQAAAATETMVFLERARPHIVILSGIAGSLDSATYPKGSVIVGKAVQWRTQTKIEDGGASGPCDKYRRQDHTITPYNVDLTNRLDVMVVNEFGTLHQPKGKLIVHYGGVFSWNYVTSGANVVKGILQDDPDACCVEMEAGGFIRAVERFKDMTGNAKILPLVVRGISDCAKQKDNDHKIRRDASYNAAVVALRLAERFIDEDFDILSKV